MSGLDAKLISFLVEFTGNEAVASITDDTLFEECGLDSLSLFQFLLAVEKSFGFTFPERDFTLSRLRSFGALRGLVAQYGGRPMDSP